MPELGSFPGEGNGYPLHYSGLENSMDCIVHGVAKSRSERLSLTRNHISDHKAWIKFQKNKIRVCTLTTV